MPICYLAVIIGIFYADLRIKNKIEKSAGKLPRELCSGRICLRLYHNQGAFLNLGRQRSRLVAAVSALLCVVLSIVFLASLGQRGNHLLRSGLALLLGGAFSNTYDRLKRRYVVDYISFNTRWKHFRNVIFNLSDFCIIVGALLIVLGAA